MRFDSSVNTMQTVVQSAQRHPDIVRVSVLRRPDVTKATEVGGEFLPVLSFVFGGGWGG
jgi:hypothetical protein